MVTKQKYLKLIQRRKTLHKRIHSIKTMVHEYKHSFQNTKNPSLKRLMRILFRNTNKEYLSLKREYNDVNDLIQAYKTIRKIQIGNIALISIKVDGE